MKFTVSGEQAGQRLDLFISENWDEAESRTDAQRSIKAGDVSLDGTKASKPSIKVSEGQVIQVSSKSEAVPELLEPTNIPLDVVYEDADIAVINKPIGMTVHPGAGHVNDTLANGAVARWPHIATVGEVDRPGIVHRLDKDTSGLMVVALTDRAYTGLQQMIWDRAITRIYSALVHGTPDSPEGVIDAPIGRDIHARTKQAIDENGRPSRTHYKLQYEIGDFSFLEVQLETGRMHQIRVHLNAIGNAVAGDQTYGKRSSSTLKGLNRQFLHASKLEFAHPVTGESLSISSDLPDDLKRALEMLSS
jgi:23S rRNA pseudouridine1911/1915/1917 synthase